MPGAADSVIGKVVLVIPTYNERHNIARLIDELQLQFSSMRHDCHVLVVDDNSPDNTADLVRKKQVEFANVHLIVGEKRGLGVAYIRGMSHALNQLGADVVFEMDADFSHKPEDVPRLMVEIDQGADFVIGSRYVTGGSIPGDWGVARRMNSFLGNILARYVAGLYKVKDCTAGFRAIRASLLRQIDLNVLTVRGYSFQLVLLYEALLKKARIKEIPVDFIERGEGRSKLGLFDIVEFIRNACWIRFRRSRTFIKFGIVGASGIAVNLGIFTLLLHAGMNKYLASPIAIEASIVTNFLFNNYWTFRWRSSADRVRVKGLKFNVVSLLALVISYSTFVTLSWVFPSTPPYVHQVIGIIPATLVNYFLNSYWTFNDPSSH